jgi:hypothetical protein
MPGLTTWAFCPRVEIVWINQPAIASGPFVRFWPDALGELLPERRNAHVAACSGFTQREGYAGVPGVGHKGVSSLEIALAPQLSTAVGASGDPSTEINQRSHHGSF